ncbi:MAG: hypothetical protein AAGA60_22475 [Cyanobacteria bacterium P01_E01_bin.42]
MKSKIGTVLTLAFVICLALFWGNTSALADDVDILAKNNIVEYTTTGGPSDVRFIYERHDITAGQPFEGVTYKYDGATLEINIRAGRKKTPEVAASFREAVAGGGTLACYTNDNLPGLLNFWVEGTLEIDLDGKTYSCPNFITAQGNISTTNNWWTAGPNFSNISGAPIAGPLVEYCSDKSGGLPKLLKITPRLNGVIPSCVNKFNITLGL